MILCIETATSICSVALCDSSGVRVLKESSDEKSHSSRLTVMIMEALNECGISARELDAVAVSKGPGSYTGLRIGVSVAKGITYAAAKPLIAINTLESMYHAVRETPLADGIDLFCPMIDARRMEVYSALFNRDGDCTRETAADIIDNNSFAGELEKNRILFFGTGAMKCRNIITHPGALFADEFTISASSMCLPAFKALNEKNFEDIAYFEPLYLKDFIATIPRKNLLNG